MAVIPVYGKEDAAKIGSQTSRPIRPAGWFFPFKAGKKFATKMGVFF